jgi:hypothetical protein
MLASIASIVCAGASGYAYYRGNQMFRQADQTEHDLLSSYIDKSNLPYIKEGMTRILQYEGPNDGSGIVDVYREIMVKELNKDIYAVNSYDNYNTDDSGAYGFLQQPNIHIGNKESVQYKITFELTPFKSFLTHTAFHGDKIMPTEKMRCLINRSSSILFGKPDIKTSKAKEYEWYHPNNPVRLNPEATYKFIRYPFMGSIYFLGQNRGGKFIYKAVSTEPTTLSRHETREQRESATALCVLGVIGVGISLVVFCAHATEYMQTKMY